MNLRVKKLMDEIFHWSKNYTSIIKLS